MAVSQIKKYLQGLRVDPQGAAFPTSAFPTATAPLKGDITTDALQWRDAFREIDPEDFDTRDGLGSYATTRAEDIEEKHGPEAAQRWYKAATTTSETLKELQEKLLAVRDYKASTKDGHRLALRELLGYLKNPEATPGDVTLPVSNEFIDKWITQQNYAYNTISDRLACLSVLWKWMKRRGLVAHNLWAGHQISKSSNPGRSPKKRAFSSDELVKLLKGNAATAKWPTMAYLPDMMVLGMYTGARIEEFCSLTAGNVEVDGSSAMLNILDSKTQAGKRKVAVVHPTALAIITRRLKRDKGSMLFPELSPGGSDKKYSSSASKAFTRYRRKCDVPDGTDFHSFRRIAITMLEQNEAGQVAIARHVGHQVNTLAADTYSAGASKAQALETAGRLVYSPEVETAVRELQP